MEIKPLLIFCLLGIALSFLLYHLRYGRQGGGVLFEGYKFNLLVQFLFTSAR